MSDMIKRQQGEDIPFTLTFEQGTDLDITSFEDFDTITCEVWTSNYPINAIELTVTPTTLTGVIDDTMTANMFGNIFMLLTFVVGTLTYKKKVSLNIFIDKKL
jgi:hypothetical protein